MYQKWKSLFFLLSVLAVFPLVYPSALAPNMLDFQRTGDTLRDVAWSARSLDLLAHRHGVPRSSSASLASTPESADRLPSPTPPPPPTVGPPIIWNHSYGGGGEELAFALVECSSGGFALAGYTNSFGAGNYDGWCVRTDAEGRQLWARSYGGSMPDAIASLVECSGGGFALAGYTGSYGGGSEVWLVRIDVDGNHLWNQTYGSPSLYEAGLSVVECRDGGFVITGTTDFAGGPSAVYLVRTDANGNHLWNQSFGNFIQDEGWSVVECVDGGFAIAGEIYSYGSGYDVWCVRIDANGNHLWNQTFGGGEHDHGREIVECNDGGFALAGDTESYGANPGINNDFWLIRIDQNGNHLWNQTYGSADYYEAAFTLVECRNGGFALAGANGTTGGFGENVWLVRTDAAGNPLWNQTLSGIYVFHGLVECREGGFAIAATKHCGATNEDFWLVRVPSPLGWAPSPVDQVVEFGSALAYDLDVTAWFSVDQWWLNDTTHFAIDTSGVVTNAIALPVGVYAVQVWVNDTQQTLLTGTFTVTVQDTTPPDWVEPVTDQTHEYGTEFYLDVNATDLSGLERWWVDDIARFTIDWAGRIRSLVLLNPGLHGLSVYVCDPYANTRWAQFTITVQDTSPPYWVEVPVDQILAYGEGFSYQLCAADCSGIDHWTLNDTVNFAIDDTGLITNATSLALGVYGLVVTAFDPYGHSVNALFTVTVRETPVPSPFPLEWPVLTMAALLGGVVGAVVASVCVALIFRRLRKP
ncbi:MAG: hypothetical protein ACFFCO_07075 [Promethearchaeota archaeon]